MKAQEQSFRFLGQVIRLKIPFFQRQYVWKEDNWEEIFCDLVAAGDKFFGSIIWKFERATGNAVKTATVIDGQQRLTTLSIFLKALADSLPDTHQNKAQEQVTAILFYSPNSLSEEKCIKIEHSELDRQRYESVIRGEKVNAENKEGIIGCYNYFREKLSTLSDDDKATVFKWLTNDDNKMLVVIELNENDDEQKIFDTINTAGVHLSVFDIVKNALFAHILNQTNDITSVSRLHDETFRATFYNKDRDRTYWEDEIKIGRLKFDNMEILLHSVAVIKGFYDPDSNRLEQLSSLYKEYIKGLTSDALTKDFIKEICEYAKLYRERFMPIGDKHPLGYNDAFSRLRHILEKADISVFNPYLLRLVKVLEDTPEANKKTAETEFENKCKELEIYVMRRFINGDETKSYNKLCKGLLSNNALPASPDDTQISQSLRAISNKRAALVLFWIELYRRQDKNFDITSLNYGYTLEHIMPQTWEDYWNLTQLPGESEDNFQKRKSIRSEAIYAIGNMTLLKGGLNSSVSNYELARKIDAGSSVRNDIRRCGDLTITKEIISEYDKAKNSGAEYIWDETKIETRTKNIEGEFFALWPS
ncbi:MAG: DUF262 domain-containing HNH endonuclease family protein [Alphaproteobacteria bacterium]|nr:DUF262 domain-containing HNH endonuclease family protein [Alphaproteobacteria bacterium]